MDEQIKKREQRFQEATQKKDVNQQWDLIAAAFEEANIIFHGLKAKDATRARGRSKITYKSSTKEGLQWTEEQEGEVGITSRVQWLRKLRISTTS